MPSIIENPCAFGTAGLPLSAGCVPSIQVTTRLGTVLANVPVSWAVTAGGGVIAPKTTVCGAYATNLLSFTNAEGRSGVCWILGQVAGANRVRAVPSVGGDAPAGVAFEPTNVEVSVVGLPGPAVAIVPVAGDGQSGPAGEYAPIVPAVRVVDAFGNGVPGTEVYWVRRPNTEHAENASPGMSITDADGIARTNWMLEQGENRLRAASYQPSHFWYILTATGTAP